LPTAGANYLVGQFCFGDLALDEMPRSVELFAAHVMPALARNERRRRPSRLDRGGSTATAAGPEQK
jgi:hypothetical protein